MHSLFFQLFVLNCPVLSRNLEKTRAPYFLSVSKSTKLDALTLSYYKETCYWIRLSIARQVFQEFRKYLHDNKIFLDRDLFKLFTEIELASIETEVELESPEPKPLREGRVMNKKLNEAVGGLFEQVENAVQRRLHFDQA